MLQFIVDHQLNLMLMLSGICGIIAFFVAITTGMPVKRRIALVGVELSAMLLLMFDRFAYIYRGDTSTIGFYMVRISNFIVFFLTLGVLIFFNHYLIELLKEDASFKVIPRRLIYVDILVLIGMALVIYSQFTGFYYIIDENNYYRRSTGFIICYLFPVIVLLLLLSAIVHYGDKLSRGIRMSLFLFTAIPLVASIAQIFLYGLSLTNISIVLMGILLYIFAINDTNISIQKAHMQEVALFKERQDSMSRLFEQTASSLASAIDEGKTHRKGHSVRVAKYSREIARRAGLNEDECKEVFFAALLHDVGKVYVPDEIIYKNEELTPDEEKILAQHTEEGGKILFGIGEYSYLSDGALYHHERYDGNGYPDNIKGEDIPELARIIAVADAYDAMTSMSDLRDPLPQTRVREEFIKESGIKYDPKFSQAIVDMIDEDTDYKLKYTGGEFENGALKDLDCDKYRSSISNGIPITWNYSRITLNCENKSRTSGKFSMPTLILFESLDGRVHNTEKGIKDNGYEEYGEIWFDGNSICTRARNIETKILIDNKVQDKKLIKSLRKLQDNSYEIETGRYNDHVRIRISDGTQVVEAVAALPDNSRYAYVAITGENCKITDIRALETSEMVNEKDIPRIADEISYINRLESDLKNIQIEGTRTVTTSSVPVRDGLRLRFHTMSLPSANFVWNCPYIVLFTSDDMEVNGPGYREFVLIRLDGEIVESDAGTHNNMLVTKGEEFDSWDTWKRLNKKGMECEVEFKKKGNKITVTTENGGIFMSNTTTVDKDTDVVYAALTGDQCALTDIRVM